MPCESEIWYQVSIVDPSCLSGESVKNFVEGAIRKTGSQWAYIGELEGAYFGLRGSERKIISCSVLVGKISDAVQYDWGFIYLYKDKPSGSIVFDNERDNISSAIVSIKLVDDNYFYLYTRNEDIFKYFINSYDNVRYKIANINDLEIPN